GTGDVFFAVTTWPSYGALTNQKPDDMEASGDAATRGKRDPRDFALWKGWKDGEPETAAWPSPWGAGRPGWHLECSAMVTKYLGTEFDIHGGGLDLRFPHHENEMAQSQAAGHPFARFWMHNGMVTYEGEKMSKSVGNTISPSEMLQLASPRVVRYYLGQAHYRSVLDYRPTSLQEAAAAVEHLDGFLAKSGHTGSTADWQDLPDGFVEAMDDDLNVPRALAVLHETVRAGNSALATGDGGGAARAAAAVAAMTAALGLDDARPAQGSQEGPEHAALDALIRSQLAERAAARAGKDWARADAIRDVLAGAGVVVEDSADGARWSLARD
ncbi:MAG: cysteine--tRNA ligase, partial [Actinomycetes bacterium]